MWRGRDGGEVRCAIRHSIDYTRNVIAVSFARRCASSPRWVKFRVGAYRYGETVVYLDDALRDEPWFANTPLVDPLACTERELKGIATVPRLDPCLTTSRLCRATDSVQPMRGVQLS